MRLDSFSILKKGKTRVINYINKYRWNCIIECRHIYNVFWWALNSFQARNSSNFHDFKWLSRSSFNFVYESYASRSSLKWASLWVRPADVNFVARLNFHQVVGFSTKPSHIKNCLGASSGLDQPHRWRGKPGNETGTILVSKTETLNMY